MRSLNFALSVALLFCWNVISVCGFGGLFYFAELSRGFPPVYITGWIFFVENLVGIFALVYLLNGFPKERPDIADLVFMAGHAFVAGAWIDGLLYDYHWVTFEYVYGFLATGGFCYALGLTALAWASAREQKATL